MKQIWKKLKRVLLAIGRVQTKILMGLMYYLVIGPMALLYQFLKRRQKTSHSYWVERETIQDWDTYLKRQF